MVSIPGFDFAVKQGTLFTKVCLKPGALKKGDALAIITRSARETKTNNTL